MELASTRNPALRVSFSEAVETNLPPDGGLYLPASLTPFPDVAELLALPWSARARAILARLLGPELSRAETDALADAALDFSVPLVDVTAPPGVAAQAGPPLAISALELFHGPTLSFKDFGVRFLARVLALLRERSRHTATRTVLTATSGDTGAAVAQAFWRLPGFRAAVLYPRGRVSPLQERQFATLGDNVRAFAVDGSFDDCQAMVKSCFADAELSHALGLLSANSINIARLLAQVLYYFEAAAGGTRGVPLVISVPSGNFGNLSAGLLAQRLGAPIATLVAATNANTTVPDYLATGAYTPRPSVATLSNAMDVGAPNNWERVEALFGNDLRAVRGGLRWGSASDGETRAALTALAGRGYRADPHGAVAFHVLCTVLRPGERGVFLATAHPAKFESTLDPTQQLPAALAAAGARPLLSETLPADAGALREALNTWKE